MRKKFAKELLFGGFGGGKFGGFVVVEGEISRAGLV